MNNLLNYIDNYGDLTFSEKPFNEIDNLIFSQLSYTDFDTIVGYNSEISLADAAAIFFKLYDEATIEKLIGISKKSAQLLKKCADTKRFSHVRLSHYANYVNGEIDKQFSAIHFLPDNGDDVVAFRGTDVTVTGVKESAMLSYMFPVPAQIEALHYFQETAMLHTGNIIICGHSKGGNLAVFAAVNCSNSLKKRLKAVYENDAPGFPKPFFDRYDYRIIRDKIHLIAPQGSIIGRMLYHDTIPHIVHSENSGLKQHQVSSWEVKDDILISEGKYDYFSDFISDYINNLIEYISDEELELLFDTLEYVAENMGIENFYDTKEIDIKKALSLVDSITAIKGKQGEKIKEILKKASTDFAKFYFTGKKQEYIEKLEKIKQLKTEAKENKKLEN